MNPQTPHDVLALRGKELADASFEQFDLRTADLSEPSPLAHEILNGKPFTYLDDAPLEERRTRAVRVRRGLPLEERDLTRLDADAIEQVREQARPEPRDEEELHDLLLGTGLWPAVDAWVTALYSSSRSDERSRP